MVMPYTEQTWDFALCPTAPDWHIDWNALLVACPWLHSMANVPQDPIYHAEGDVLVHTRMVVEALAQLAEWRALSATERSIVFVAALLHDIGKPSTTTYNADGRISSRGHARRGAALARLIVWNGEGFSTVPPLAIREAIVALVRLHGLPLWFLDKTNIEASLFAASYRANLSLVALLAEADARGRVCADQHELIAYSNLFREFCEEHACRTTPRPFPSDHSRMRYFRGRQLDPQYCAFDDTWGEVVVMSGLPGAGKDTWVQMYGGDLPVVSLDALRAQMQIAPEKNQGAVVQAAKQLARDHLRRKQPFIWNATNITRQLRDPLIDLLLDYNARCRIIYLDAPLTQIAQRNRERSVGVPHAVVQRLAGKLDLPDLTEAHMVEYCYPEK